MPDIVIKRPTWQKPLKGATLNRRHPLARNLVGCWVFNELTGKRVFDYAQNQLAAFAGSDVSGGVWWEADNLEFDNAAGQEAYLEIAGYHSAPSYVPNDWTVISCCKPQNLDYQTLLCWSAGDHPQILIPFLASSSKPFLYMSDGWYRYFHATNIVFDTYQVHAFVHPTDIDNSKYYLDGVEQGADAATSSGSPTAETTTKLFAASFSGYAWEGGIKWIYIYDRALSAEEIAYLSREPYCIFQRRKVLDVATGAEPQTVTANTAAANAVAPSATMTPGGITVTANAAVANAVAPSGTITAGGAPQTVTANAAVANAVAPSATMTPGAITVTANTAMATAVAPSATITLGGITVTANAAVANAVVPSGTVTVVADQTVTANAAVAHAIAPSARVSTGGVDPVYLLAL